jgi:hypothetical protein
VSPLSAASIGLGTAGRAGGVAVAVIPADSEPTPVLIGPAPVDIGPRARIADVVIGFPQSMQNRDDASFSRPQKAQVASELTGG